MSISGRARLLGLVGDMDRSELKKRELVNKYIESCTKKYDKCVDSDSFCNESDVANSKDQSAEHELFLKLKLENKELRGKIASLNQTNKALREDRARLKKQHQSMKAERFELNQEFKCKCKDIETLSTVIADKDDEIRKLQEDKLFMKKALDTERTVKKKEDIRKIKNTNAQLKRSNEGLKAQNKALSARIANYQMLRDGELESDKIKALKKALMDKDSLISELRNKNLELSCIEKKYKQLTETRVEKTQSVECDRDANGICSEVAKKDPLIRKYRYGCIEKSESKAIFKDVDGAIFDIENVQAFASLYDSCPCKVKVVSSDTVKLVKIYDTVDVQPDMAKYGVTVRKIKTLNESLYKGVFNGEKVLVVGSRYKSKYISNLEKAGLEVNWYEAYSDSLNRLADMVKAVDVVIVCTSHCSHACTDKLKSVDDFCEDNNKYQFIEKDSVMNIVARIRYAIENKDECFKTM